MSVRRVYVEKKPDFAVAAKDLAEEIKSYLSIDSVDKVRVLIRYDVENVSDVTYHASLGTDVYKRQVLDFYFSMRNFMDIYERLDDHYKIYSQMLPDGKFMVRLFCVNPAANLKQCMEQGRSTVFFSATMLPVRYYRELLSGGEEDYAVYVASPFPRENRAVYRCV